MTEMDSSIMCLLMLC